MPAQHPQSFLSAEQISNISAIFHQIKGSGVSKAFLEQRMQKFMTDSQVKKTLAYFDDAVKEKRQERVKKIVNAINIALAKRKKQMSKDEIKAIYCLITLRFRWKN